MQPAKGHTKPTYRSTSVSSLSRMAGWGAFFGVAGLAANVSAQVPGTSAAGSVSAGNGFEATAAVASGELKTSQVIADPGAPYTNLFQNFGVGLSGQPKVGGFHTHFNVGPVALGNFAGIPIKRGSRPEGAEVKIGNFYLDLLYLSGSLLYSDNVNLTETNRKGGVGGAITLGVTGLYQLNEGLQVSVSGAFIYLPFENKFGISGFGIVDPFAQFALDSQSLFSAGASYDTLIGGWQMSLYDDFRIINRTLYSLGDQADLDFYDGETFDEQSSFRKQRIYTAPTSGGRVNRRTTQSASSFDISELTYINTAGVTLSRVLPPEIDTRLGYYHQNFWYSGSQQSLTGGALPSYYDTFFLRAESIRENLRFKPYVFYNARTSDLQRGWDQYVGGGLRGPVTDYINFDGNVGYVFSGNTGNTSLIWQLELEHEISPTMSQRIGYYRVLTEPDRQLRETYQYQVRKILGPYMTSGAFARHSVFSDLDTNADLLTQDQVGLFWNYNLAEQGQVALQGFYSKNSFNDPTISDYESWTFRAIYSRQLAATIYGDFIYQFERRDSSAANDSYYENLVAVRLTKVF